VNIDNIKSVLSFVSIGRLNSVIAKYGDGLQCVTKKDAIDKVAVLVMDRKVEMSEVKTINPSAEVSSAPVASSSMALNHLKQDLETMNADLLAVANTARSAMSEARDIDNRIVALHDEFQSKLGSIAVDESAVRKEVAKVFASFKKVTPVAELETIASAMPVVTRKKVAEVFDGDLSYEVDGERVDFSNLEVDVWDDVHAPKRVNDYVFQPRHLHFALIALANELPHNMWLGGERSTGKTEFVTQLASRLGRRLFRINFDEAIERAEFIGGNTIESGNVVWKEGIVTQAIQYTGSLVLFDEIGFARAQNLAVLHSLCERSPHRSITIAETGKRIAVSPHVAFFVADNSLGYGDSSGNFAGVRDMNTAFIDRFSYTLKFNYLKPADEIKIVISRTGIAKEVATMLVQFANSAREKAQAGVLTQPPSLRSLLAWADAIKHGLPVSLAFENAIINKFPADCEAELRGLYTALIDAVKLKSYLTK
jgi:cobaltochelatase CobS